MMNQKKLERGLYPRKGLFGGLVSGILRYIKSMSPKLITLFILIICLLDNVVILQGEVRYQSLPLKQSTASTLSYTKSKINFPRYASLEFR